MISFPGSAKRKSRRAPVRRRVWPRWMRPVLIAFGAISLLTGAAGSGWWLWHSETGRQMVAAASKVYRDANRAAGLVTREVLVEGRTETPRTMLLKALAVRRGDLILEFDVDEARRRVERIGWVASARVERRLPDTIRVSIVERVPVAVWQEDGKFFLVDAGGAVIGSERVARFSHLKVVVGADAPAHAQALLAMLQRHPALMARVTAAVRAGGRRWNLRLDNGVDVRLPERDAFAAWDRLARYEAEHGLLERDIRTIDLRIPDRVVVRVNDVREPETPAPGSRT